MSKSTKSFSFITPLSIREYSGGKVQIMHIADIIVTGNGTYNNDFNEPFTYNYERIQYQEKGKEPIDIPVGFIDWQIDNTLGECDWLTEATIAHLKHIFNYDESVMEPQGNELPDIFSTLGSFLKPLKIA